MNVDLATSYDHADSERTRRAVYQISLMLAFAAAMTVLTRSLVDPILPTSLLVATAGMTCLAVLGLFAHRSPDPSVAGWLIVITVLVTIWAAAAANHGVQAPVLPILCILPLLGGQVVDRPRVGITLSTLLAIALVQSFSSVPLADLLPFENTSQIPLGNVRSWMLTVGILLAGVFAWYQHERWILVLKDQDRRRRMERALFENVTDVVAVTDLDGTIHDLNRAGRDFFALAVPSATNVRQLYADAGGREDFLERIQTNGSVTGYESRFLVEGNVRVLSGSSVLFEDPEGGPSRILSILHDVTKQHERAQRLEVQATTDALTGLANRAALETRLKAELADDERDDRSIALLMLDLDCLKTTNDTYGHCVGDQLLQLVARRLQRVVRADDLLARLGGDEFVLLETVETSERCALSLAERLLRQFDEPASIGGRSIEVGLSIGVAVSAPGETGPELLERADRALYLAKERGRNRYELACPPDDGPGSPGRGGRDSSGGAARIVEIHRRCEGEPQLGLQGVASIR